jgi:hypothetical protein
VNFRVPVFTLVTFTRGTRNSQLIAESLFQGSAKAPSLDQQASNQGRTPKNRPNVNIGTEKSPQRQQLLVHIGYGLHLARSSHWIKCVKKNCKNCDSRASNSIGWIFWLTKLNKRYDVAIHVAHMEIDAAPCLPD